LTNAADDGSMIIFEIYLNAIGPLFVLLLAMKLFEKICEGY